MINSIETYNIEDRLNIILEKISALGESSIDSEERGFLKSYSIGKESEINNMLNEKERMVYISDDGFFTFKLRSIEYLDTLFYITGILIVPDMFNNGRKIEGKLEGTIIVFGDGKTALDFRKGRYDIFEFVSGIEYELDCFIDEIASNVE